MKISIKSLGLAGAFLFAASTHAATPPTITCSGDQVLECTSTNGALGVVSATVQDADGDGLMVIWAINGHAAETNILAAGDTTNAITLSLTNSFAVGTNDVSVGVTDDGTNVVMCSSTVVVQDTTPPQIRSIVASPNVLWPPNHKMRPIAVVVRADDACGPVSWHITQITSNEPEDGLGDGNTSPDSVITGPHKALLRAERSGKGSGRIYTLDIEVSDQALNTTNGSVRVTVPHDRGHGSRWNDDEDDDDHNDSGDDRGRGNGKGNGKDKGKKHGKN
jgi:hypothetical protein